MVGQEIIEQEDLEQEDLEQEESEKEIDPFEEYRQRMLDQEIATEEEGGEFFTDTSFGKVKVDLPTGHESLFSYAEEVDQRETGAKKRGGTVEQQIRTGKQEMAANERAFADARNAEEILRRLQESGQLLLADVRSPKLPQEGLQFIIPDHLKHSVRKAFERLGYVAEKIEDGGVVIRVGTTAYTFLTAKQAEKYKEGDEDYLDDDEHSDSGGEGRSTKAVKNKLKGRRPKQSAKQAGGKPTGAKGRKTTSDKTDIENALTEIKPNDVGISEINILPPSGGASLDSKAATIGTKTENVPDSSIDTGSGSGADLGASTGTGGLEGGGAAAGGTAAGGGGG